MHSVPAGKQRRRVRLAKPVQRLGQQQDSRRFAPRVLTRPGWRCRQVSAEADDNEAAQKSVQTKSLFAERSDRDDTCPYSRMHGVAAAASRRPAFYSPPKRAVTGIPGRPRPAFIDRRRRPASSHTNWVTRWTPVQSGANRFSCVLCYNDCRRCAQTIKRRAAFYKTPRNCPRQREQSSDVTVNLRSKVTSAQMKD